MRLRVILRVVLCLCVALCWGCLHLAEGSLENIASSAQQNWEHGNLPEAWKLSRRGELLSEYASDRVWKWRFLLIQADILIIRRNWEEAAKLLDAPVPAQLSKTETATRLYIDRGVVRAWEGRYSSAEKELSKAAELCTLSENARWFAEVKRREGLLAYLQGRRTEAADLTRQAVSLAREYHQPLLEANALASLAAIYMNAQRWGDAADWLQPAMNLARKISSKTLIQMNAGNLGWCYYNLGDSETALAHLTEADHISGEIQLAVEQRRWVTDIGVIYYDRDDFTRAADYHSRSLVLARQTKDPEAIADCLYNLALTAFNREDFFTAESYNREEITLRQKKEGVLDGELYARYLDGHIRARKKDFEKALAIFKSIAADSGNNLSLRWQAQVSCAQVNVARNEPRFAEKCYEGALQTISMGRREAGRDEFKLSYREGRNRYYTDYIEFLMQRGRTADALNVAETSRAQILSERLGVATTGKATPAHLQETAKSLKSVILSYWLAPEESYLWVVTPTELTSVKLPAADKIMQLVEAHRRTISAANHALNTRLYEMLIAPAQKFIKPGSRVVVIPDSGLFQINFETLQVPGFQQPHYWIEDAVISTATSASLLRPHAPLNSSGNILLIGNPISPNLEFPALPHAGTELHEIADRFPANDKVLFEGPGARPSAYGQAKPGSYSWIHFAAHGISSKESPLESAIILSNEGDSYKLYARDIAAIPLKADLVTVSACYGSGSRAYAGEGIVGLAWAFLLAGAHNVVASLWEANDYYTAQLMDKMYERLKAGDDPAHALRSAKLTLLHSPYICRNPRYWGAFQLYTGY